MFWQVFDMLVFLLFSGQQPENPLLLLGQYSDDELEDSSNERPSNGTVENSSPANDDKVIKGITFRM